MFVFMGVIIFKSLFHQDFLCNQIDKHASIAMETMFVFMGV